MIGKKHWKRQLQEKNDTQSILSLPKYAPLYFIRNRKGYFTGFLFLTLVSAITTCLSFLATFVLSEIITKINEITVESLLQTYLVVFIAILFFTQVLDYLMRRYGEAFPRIFTQHKIIKVYESILPFSTVQLQQYSKERLYNVITKYMGNVQEFLNDWFWGTSRNFVKLVIIFGILLVQSPLIFGINIVYVGIFISISFYLSSKMAPFIQAESQASLDTTALQQNFIQSILAVDRLKILPFSVQHLQQRTERQIDTIQASQNFHASRWFLQLNLFNAIFIFSFFFGVYQVIEGELELGFLLLIKFAFDNLVGVLIYFVEYYVSLIRQAEDTEVLRKELADIFTTEKQEKVKSIASFKSLQFEQVTCTVRTKEEQMLEINYPSFELYQGGSVLITGPSGSGKSTLANILRGALPYSGMIRINNSPSNPKSLAQHITTITSDEPFFSLSLRDNLLLGQQIEESFLQDVLDGVAAHSFLKKDWDREESMDHFSSGQLQRLRLARGLLQDTEIYILDEALNGIDAQTKSKIIHFLNEFLENKTVLYITHNADEINQLQIDRRYEIREGRLVES